MDAEGLIVSLSRFALILPALVREVKPSDARWKPADLAWSIREIVRHLINEEVEDFRLRLELPLRAPAAPWPPNDPEKFAVERKYNEGELTVATNRFVAEREKSLAWLATLADADWHTAHHHPIFGTLRAGDL